MQTADRCRSAVLISEAKKRELLDRVDAHAQARLVARRRILVQRALLDGFVEGRNGLAVGLFGRALVALFDGHAQFAQLRTES